MWRRWSLIGMALLTILGGLVHSETASAKDIRFIASDLAPGRAIWLPGMIMIDQKNDLEEPLLFILENPNEFDHEFAVHDLFMILREHMTSALHSDRFTGPFTRNVMMPIRVLVKAKATETIEVSPQGLNGKGEKGTSEPGTYFFAPCTKMPTSVELS